MSVAKTIGGVIGLIRAVPLLICYPIARAILGPEKSFIAVSERVGRIPGFLGVYTRQQFYKRTLGGVGRDVYFGFMSMFSKRQATLGDRVYIGRFCTIGWATIGDDVMLADGVQILSGRHQHSDGGTSGAMTGGESLREREPSFSQVAIGKGAWLGAGAIVMADVGEGAIVGAGAVVVKAVPAGAKVGGVPAKVLE